MKYLFFFSLFFFSIKILIGKQDPYPNIIIILADDQGWGDLSINGNRNLSTPNIDNLAKSGITFDRFYACAVCSPTRAELLTGRYHVRGGVYHTSRGGERLDLNETTIAEYFKKNGYRTAVYGKWHNGMQPPYHPNARGFDDFYGFCSGHWGNYFSPMLEHNGEIVKGNGFIINDLTDHGIKFIKENRDKPFFLYLPFNTPHSPMQVPDQWWERFKNKELIMHNRDFEKEDIQFTRAALAMNENIDWNVGRIVRQIDNLELSEKTIIVYLSDNGPNSWRWNGGMKGRKGSVDEGGVRVPAFIKWEGTIDSGRTINNISSVIDIFPTLADLAGIKIVPAKPLDGVSLKPLLMREESIWEERFLFNYWNKKLSVRSQKFRLGPEGELFDMKTDPGQTKDVSKNFPAIKRKLLQAKLEWETTILSELPQKDDRFFTIGHPDFTFSQFPARDGNEHGNIKRSAVSPNCTFFTNWESLTDSITWEIESLSEGEYMVEIYYSCPLKDVGSIISLSFEGENISCKIVDAHDPPLEGMEHDRITRTQSYVKDFKPLEMGSIHLKKGKGTLTLKATDIPGLQVMDFRLLLFKRI